MRIALVVYGDLEQRTGGYLYDRMLVQHLRTLGCKVDVISLSSGGRDVFSKLRVALQDGYDVFLEDELTHVALLGFWVCHAQFYAHVRRKPPRVAIVHNLASSAVEIGKTKHLRKFLERRYLQGVDGLILNSKHTLQEVQRLIGDLPPHVVIPGAADHLPWVPDEQCSVEFLKNRAQKRPVQILFVGNLSPVKGLHLLLPTLTKLPRGWCLNVVGSLQRNPKYAQKMLHKVKTLGLENDVHFLGEQSAERVAELYLQHSIFVLSSPQEGFGLAYLEAMSFGLAVVASSEGAAPELIEHKKTGILVAPVRATVATENAINAIKWTEALTELIQNPEQVWQLGQAARGAAKARPTWLDAGRSVLAFLSTMTKN